MNQPKIEYSNPRKSAVFHDWPYGRLRTTCTFEIETTQRGERAVRTTINPKTGQATAPKALTYSVRQLIVDGDDGKTYILRLTMYGHISVMQSNMQFQQESVHPDDARYAALAGLFADKVTA